MVFHGDFGQVREHVVVEATWLGNFEPFSVMPVSSHIYEMMNAKKQNELIKQYNMAPFSIQVLSKMRTLCEKIMSLVRFSRSKEPITDLKNKIRHVYDIHRMLKDDAIQQFFKDSEFDEMLVKVGQDDMIGYKNNNEWITEHPATALIFEKPWETWEQLRSEYYGNFKDLVIGELPEEGAIVETLFRVSARLKNVTWEF